MDVSIASSDEILVEEISPNAKVPTKSTRQAAGYDLYAVERALIPRGERRLIGIGLKMKIPKGWHGRIVMRSGLAARHGPCIGGDVIGSDYTGHVMIIVFNPGEENFPIKEGDRVAQLVAERKSDGVMRHVSSLPHSDGRGERGFGSGGC